MKTQLSVTTPDCCHKLLRPALAWFIQCVYQLYGGIIRGYIFLLNLTLPCFTYVVFLRVYRITEVVRDTTVPSVHEGAQKGFSDISSKAR